MARWVGSKGPKMSSNYLQKLHQLWHHQQKTKIQNFSIFQFKLQDFPTLWRFWSALYLNRLENVAQNLHKNVAHTGLNFWCISKISGTGYVWWRPLVWFACNVLHHYPQHVMTFLLAIVDRCTCYSNVLNWRNSIVGSLWRRYQIAPTFQACWKLRISKQNSISDLRYKRLPDLFNISKIQSPCISNTICHSVLRTNCCNYITLKLFGLIHPLHWMLFSSILTFIHKGLRWNSIQRSIIPPKGQLLKHATTWIHHGKHSS